MDLNTPQGVWAKDFFDHSAKFHEKLYDWPIDKVRDYINANSRNGFIYIEFSYKQLGRSEQWFKEQAQALDGDLFKIKREILLQWNKSSDLSPFSEAEIIRLHDHVQDPITTLMINGIYPVNIYNAEFNWRGNLMIGVDTSPGMSRDATAVVVWDPTIGEIVATFHNNTMDAPSLQEFLVELVGTYFTNAVVIIERNNGGIQLIDFLLKTKIAKNLFYERKEIKAEKKVTDPKMQKARKFTTNYYGHNTDNKTRPLMIEILRDIVADEYNTLNCKELVDEIAGLERTKNDKIEHGEGGHDDLVMAYLLVRYVWRYGKNLGNWFISRSQIEAGAGTPDGKKEYMRRMNAIKSLNQQSFDRQFPDMGGMYNSKELMEDYYRRQKYIEDQEEIDEMTKRRSNMFRGIMDLNKK